MLISLFPFSLSLSVCLCVSLFLSLCLSLSLSLHLLSKCFFACVFCSLLNQIISYQSDNLSLSLNIFPSSVLSLFISIKISRFFCVGSRQGREATKIFDTMRKELSIKKDVIVEISLDNSHAGSKIYNDLLLLTQVVIVTNMYGIFALNIHTLHVA